MNNISSKMLTARDILKQVFSNLEENYKHILKNSLKSDSRNTIYLQLEDGNVFVISITEMPKVLMEILTE